MPRRLLNITTSFCLSAAVLAVAARDAHGVLAHRYSFTGNLVDSIAAANGTMVDVGAPTATFTAGQLDLSANNGNTSNTITEDAYVDLPNGLISGVAANGVSNAFSIELWATISTQRTWQRFVDFGTSNGGENTSGGGGDSPYIYLAANSGRFTNGLSTEVHAQAPPAPPLREVGVTGPAPLNTQIHLVGTYDANDLSAGPQGTFKLYNNGALVGQGALPPNLPLNTFTNNNNWIGRSQWNDPVFDGLVNELRLYDNALTASEVGANSILGPDTLTGQILKIQVNKNTGAMSLINATTQNLNFDFYRITSAGNALNFGGWNSLDDQNFGAVDGTDVGDVAGDTPGEGFDQIGASGAGQLAELNLRATGATINASQSLSLGNAFNTSVFGNGVDGDLQMTFGLVGGIQITGSVEYVTGGPAGNYDGDSDVDGNDFLRWQRGQSPNPLTPADLTAWKNNYGAGGAIGAAGAVPEPASLSLVALAAAGLLGARRRD